MKSWIFFVALLAVSFFQATTITAPFIIMLFVLFYVFSNSFLVLFAVFLSGLIFDTLLLHPLGSTSMVFLGFILLLLLYERKFETRTFQFVFFATFLGSMMFLLTYQFHFVIEQALFVSIISVFIFFLIERIGGRHKDTQDAFKREH